MNALDVATYVVSVFPGFLALAWVFQIGIDVMVRRGFRDVAPRRAWDLLVIITYTMWVSAGLPLFALLYLSVAIIGTTRYRRRSHRRPYVTAPPLSPPKPSDQLTGEDKEWFDTWAMNYGTPQEKPAPLPAGWVFSKKPFADYPKLDACPRCGAPLGAICKGATVIGEYVLLSFPHPERRPL